MKKEYSKKLVIGVDGGGTKTESWLANSDGRVLGKGKSGPSNLRNVGIQKAAENIALAIKQSMKNKRNVSIVFLGLAAIEEEYRNKKEAIKKELLKQGGMGAISRARIFFDSDQMVAFKSGTDKRDGIVAISGTGCVVHGWKDKKDVKSSGWGWLDDEGSAFWIGQKAYQEAVKTMDGRGKPSLLSKMMIQKFKAQFPWQINKKIYGPDLIRNVSLLSIMVDQAAKRGDRVSRQILESGGKKLGLASKAVLKELRFKKDFPVVMIGGMFKSRHFTNSFKKEVKKENSFARFVVPKKDPVYGAVKLAIEKIHEKKRA